MSIATEVADKSFEMVNSGKFTVEDLKTTICVLTGIIHGQEILLHEQSQKQKQPSGKTELLLATCCSADKQPERSERPSYGDDDNTKENQ